MSFQSKNAITFKDSVGKVLATVTTTIEALDNTVFRDIVNAKLDGKLTIGDEDLVGPVDPRRERIERMITALIAERDRVGNDQLGRAANQLIWGSFRVSAPVAIGQTVVPYDRVIGGTGLQVGRSYYCFDWDASILTAVSIASFTSTAVTFGQQLPAAVLQNSWFVRITYPHEPVAP